MNNPVKGAEIIPFRRKGPLKNEAWQEMMSSVYRDHSLSSVEKMRRLLQLSREPNHD
jgi:hypothetical protein